MRFDGDRGLHPGVREMAGCHLRPDLHDEYDRPADHPAALKREENSR
jgi:hypothetical protein